MAYPNYQSSDGIKTSGTILEAQENLGSEYVYDELVVTNHSTAVLYLKHGPDCSATDFDHILAACTVSKDGTGGSISITKIAAAQEISCYSTDIKYTSQLR